MKNNEKYIPIPQLPKNELEIKEEFFKNYRSYRNYYKAKNITISYTNLFCDKPYKHITNLDFEVMRSYNTIICIRFNDILILNKDYYNSSLTTKNQLEFFLRDKKTSKRYYLNSNVFYEMYHYLIKNEIKKFWEKLELIEDISENQRNIISNLNDKTIINIIKNGNIENKKVIPLKTRNRIELIVNYQFITFRISYSERKRSKKQLSKFKVKILDNHKNYLLFEDLRNFEEKKLFNGFDIGVANRKEDFL